MEPEHSLRERLVDVGVELVAAEGVGSLGLREIARRAGVSHGAPRRYFPTHRALLSAIARRGFDELAELFAEINHRGGGPRDQLWQLARAQVRFACEQREMYELMLRHDLLDSGDADDGQPRLREASLPLFELTVGLVSRHWSDLDDLSTTDDPTHGPAEHEDPADVAAALWANVHGIAQLWSWGSLALALKAPSPDAPDSTEALERLITRTLNAHLGRVDT